MISCLYVDDDRDFLQVVKVILEQNVDINIDTCPSIIEAMERLRSFSYDIIISDHNLPFFTGLEFLKMVRSEFGDIPFVLFTSREKNDSTIIESISAKSVSYFQISRCPQFLGLLYLIRSEVNDKKTRVIL